MTHIRVYEYDRDQDDYSELCRFYDDGTVEGGTYFSEDVQTTVNKLTEAGFSVQDNWDVLEDVFLEKYNNGYLRCTVID